MIRYTIVGGFLGAGKTTLINGLLRAATERVAVIVNDIGQINIDAALIKGQPDADLDDNLPPDTIELTNGCVCCSIGDSLATTLRALCQRPEPPEHIVLECSGAANPAKVAEYGSRKVLTEPLMVIVADATDVRRRADDSRFADLVRDQLDCADLIAVTKTDIVDDVEPITSWLTERCDAAVVVGRPEDFGSVLGSVMGSVLPRNRTTAGDESMERSIPPILRTETRVFDGPVDPSVIERWLGSIDGLVRAKGVVDAGSGPRLVQWSAGRFSSEPWHGAPLPSAVVTIS